MRQLLPEPRDDVDPAQAYADDIRGPVGSRPWVLVNMIASVDGATAVESRSGSLGGPADKAVFRAIRAVADVVLVAAGTARAERYRAPALPDDLRAARRRRGQPELPRLAVVSGRLDLDDILEAFDPSGPRPIVVTATDADEDRRRRVERRAEIVGCGTASVDLGAALSVLRDRYAAGVVAVEGGPSLNGALAAADLIDELCLSLAPALVAGDSHRIVRATPPRWTPLALARILEDDGYLFLRFTRARSTPDR
jgi:riboflavin biosynthesis pyrimidine reductase